MDPIVRPKNMLPRNVVRKRTASVAITLQANDVPRKGDTQVIFRTNVYDKLLIDKAATALGMKLADYLRTLTVRAAEQIILAAYGKDEDEEG